jgi:two-component system KDP operon response regulator KdpE
MHGEAPGRFVLGAIVVDLSPVMSSPTTVVESACAPKEFNLLGYLVSHPNQVLSDRELLQAVWGPESGTEYERLRVVVNQLRKKIEPTPSRPVILVTVARVGYQLFLEE